LGEKEYRELAKGRGNGAIENTEKKEKDPSTANVKGEGNQKGDKPPSKSKVLRKEIPKEGKKDTHLYFCDCK